VLVGKWTFRSFNTLPALIGSDAKAALGLILQEGFLNLDATGLDSFSGGMGISSGLALAVEGTVIRHDGGEDGEEYALTARGIPGTPTQGWRYEYRCATAYAWPEAANQQPALLGTVLRARAHGPKAPAGATASFIAIRQTGLLAHERREYHNVLAAGI